MTAKSIAWGIAAGVTTGLVLDWIREERAAVRAKQLAEAPSVGSLLGLVGVLAAGTYSADVQTIRYNGTRTPLDDLVKSGAVKLRSVILYGPIHGYASILIDVPKRIESATVQSFREWADWTERPADVEPRTLLDPEKLQAGDEAANTLDGLQSFSDQAKRLGQKIVDLPGQAVDAVSLAMWGVAGALVVGAFFRARGRV